MLLSPLGGEGAEEESLGYIFVQSPALPYKCKPSDCGRWLASYHFRIWRSPYQARYPSDATAAAITIR